MIFCESWKILSIFILVLHTLSGVLCSPAETTHSGSTVRRPRIH